MVDSAVEPLPPAALVACKTCGKIHELPPLVPGMVARCVRCNSIISRRTPASLHITAAFSLAALLLYIPANVFPILHMEIYGATSDNTVLDGCYRLYIDGDVVIAVVVFLASILIPVLKLFALFFVVITTRLHSARWKMLRTWLFKIVEGIGRWAMLDVFVLAVLVSAVKLQRLATIIPGKGMIAFAGVVVFTLFASASFDPQLIWEQDEMDA